MGKSTSISRFRQRQRSSRLTTNNLLGTGVVMVDFHDGSQPSLAGSCTGCNSGFDPQLNTAYSQ